MSKITLNVTGMSCGHCVNAIESSVGDLSGIRKVNVDLASGKVEIEYNEAEVTIEAIKETIDEQGYDVD